jgi:enoyl-CoA hydratase/carnithine racemase
MLRAFLHALKMGDQNPEVGAIIVTGRGRAFSAGTDISGDSQGFQGNIADKASNEPDFGGVIALQIYRSSKPVIAAVNGPAVGFGSTSVLPMDVRIATDDAYFSFIFARRGLMPEACSTWFLPRVVGINRALDWALSGRVVKAHEAVSAGLLTEIVAPEKLLDRAREIAAQLVATTSPTSLAVTRRALWAMLSASGPESAHQVESEGLRLLRASGDFREAMKGFHEKRTPGFAATQDAAVTTRIDRLLDDL